MLEISMTQILKLMGTKTILKDVNIHIYENERVGLIGNNGSGKSTILKLFAGIIKLKLFPGEWSPGYDYGFINIPKNTILGYLNQEPNYNQTVLEVLQSNFIKLIKIENKMRALEVKMASATDDLEEIFEDYTNTTHQFEQLGGYDYETRINKIISGLNLKPFIHNHFNDLSGGEKTRVELGKLLVQNPDVLLLDEPTNHLDEKTIQWLENYLKSYKGMIVIVSHDRYFLDQMTTHIIEIEDLSTHKYTGNYSRFKEQKDELNRIHLNQYDQQQKEIASMKKKIQTLREYNQSVDHNKFFKRASSIQNKLDRLKRIKKPIKEKNMRLTLNDQFRSGKEAIVIKNVSHHYDEVLLNNISETIFYGDRVSLSGPNGSGKSTLLKIILNEIRPSQGRANLGASTKLGYLSQHITFENEEETVLQCFKGLQTYSDGYCREYLSKFMFYGKDVYTEVKVLSGGEKIRLSLAMMLHGDINLLILDEPTNHLDINAIETLEDVLEDFKGTILFVSHDRYFIDKIAQRRLTIENKQIRDLSKKIPVSDDQENKIHIIENDLKKIDHQLASCDDHTFYQLMDKREALEKELDQAYLNAFKE